MYGDYPKQITIILGYIHFNIWKLSTWGGEIFESPFLPPSFISLRLGQKRFQGLDVVNRVPQYFHLRDVNGGEILSLPQISRSSWSHIGHSLLHHWQTFGSLWLGELLVCCLRISNASFTFMFVSWSSFWYSPFSSTTKMANSMKSIVLILKDEWKLTSSWLNRVHLSKPFSLSHGGCMSSVNPHLQKRPK